MGMFPGLLFLTITATAFCFDDLLLPTEACRIWEFYANAARINVEFAGNFKLTFDVKQLDKNYILHHDSSNTKSWEWGNFFFDLYKPNPEARQTKQVHLTAQDVEAAFLEKENRRRKPTLNKRDVVNAFDIKKGFQPGREKDAEEGYQVGLTEEDVETMFVEKRASTALLERRDFEGAFAALNPARARDFQDVFFSDDVELKRIVPLSYDERPKLYVTKQKQRVRMEYALKMIQIELPTRLYDSDNKLPVYVKITLSFIRRNQEEDVFTVEFPVYGDYEQGITADKIMEHFIKDLAGDSNAMKHQINRDLNMLKSALKSATSAKEPVYYNSGDKKFVTFASCQYIQEEILRDLFFMHRMDIHSFYRSEEADELTDKYADDLP